MPAQKHDRWQRIDDATRSLPAPLAVVDLEALDANAADLERRANGRGIRIATKSVRCRAVLDRVLRRTGFRGLMAYSLAEAVWLAQGGATDVLVAYPSVDADALACVRTDPGLAEAITVMVDDPAHLEVIEAARGDHPVRVCLDVDASYRVAGLHLGVRRSSVHSVDQAVEAARAITGCRSTLLVGLMFYDAQVAGLPDSSPAVRALKSVSLRELAGRRPAIVEAVGRFADLQIVNGGGTGSLDAVAADPCLTEVAAGSGLYGPTLFDGYRSFSPRPALAYALPVTRRPAADVRTVFGGGYVASGPTDASRQPVPVHPPGLQTTGREGVGEVQTPLRGPGAARLRVGDRVWWRHPKAGEVCERFAELHLIDVDSGESMTVPTYRGEGQCFG